MLKKIKILGLIALIPMAMSLTRPANSLVTLTGGLAAAYGWYVIGAVVVTTGLTVAEGGLDDLTSGMGGLVALALIPALAIAVLEEKGLPALDGAEGLQEACGISPDDANELEDYAPIIEAKSQDFMKNIPVSFERLSEPAYAIEANAMVKEAILASVNSESGLSAKAANAWIQLRECGNI